MTLCWDERGHAVRLDEYAARLAPEYGKTVAGAQAVEWIDLGGGAHDALWFPEPHLLRFWMTSEDGSRFTRSERTAGPTLLWIHDDEFTLRLEGVASKARAREIAESLELDRCPSGWEPRRPERCTRSDTASADGPHRDRSGSRMMRGLRQLAATAGVLTTTLALLLLGAPPSAAGGPTSVLLVSPTSRRTASLYATDKQYDLLGEAPGPCGLRARRKPGGGSGVGEGGHGGRADQ